MRRSHVLITVLALAILLAIPCVYYARAELAAQRKAQQVLTLVSVGDDLDEVISTLRGHGIRVGDKVTPIRAKDYWQAVVPLREAIPAPATFEYVTGMSVPFGDPTMYVILTADLDGSINAIEVQ